MGDSAGPMATIDSPLADALKRSFPLLTEDADAHRSEHAVEVELPFLQVRRPDFTFVPIALGTGQFEILEKLGEAIAEAVQAQGEIILIVASSDMNHYENDAVTRVKDHKAIEQDAGAGCPRAIRCGHAGRHQHVRIRSGGRDANRRQAHWAQPLAELIKYATSGDVSGDREMVVGYAGIVVR